MSAELLRRAATKLREHAKAATAGPWIDEYSGETGNIVLAEDSHHAREWVARTQLLPAVYDAKYIALMHPPVALALADALDQWAAQVERREQLGVETTAVSAPVLTAMAALARAILREPEPSAAHPTPRARAADGPVPAGPAPAPESPAGAGVDTTPGKARAEPVRRWATARKPFMCRACGKPVAAGTRYWQVAPPFVPASRFCSTECDPGDPGRAS